jgi:hypothetical protein
MSDSISAHCRSATPPFASPYRLTDPPAVDRDLAGWWAGQDWRPGEQTRRGKQIATVAIAWRLLARSFHILSQLEVQQKPSEKATTGRARVSA